MNRWRKGGNEQKVPDAEGEVLWGNLLQMAKKQADYKEGRPLMTQVFAGYGKVPPLLSLSEGEKKDALPWVLQNLEEKRSLEAEVLVALLQDLPIYTLPAYHRYVGEDRRKREESARNRQISDDWENLAKNGFTFDADGFEARLTAYPDVKIEGAAENFCVKGVLADGRTATARLDFRGLRIWMDLVRGEAARIIAVHGIKPVRFTIPLNISFSFHARTVGGASLGQLGSDIRLLMERSIPLTLECTRK